MTIIGLPSVSRVIPWRKSFPGGMSLPSIFSEVLAVALSQLLMTKQGFSSGRSSEAWTLNDKAEAVAVRW